jgi:hypothetical protein
MILLQILDEGTITDSQGRKVDFRVRYYHNSPSHHFHHLSFFMHRTPLFASRVTLVRLNLLTQCFRPSQTNRPHQVATFLLTPQPQTIQAS